MPEYELRVRYTAPDDDTARDLAQQPGGPLGKTVLLEVDPKTPFPPKTRKED